MHLFTIQENAFGACLEQIAHLVSVLCRAANVRKKEIFTVSMGKTSA